MSGLLLLFGALGAGALVFICFGLARCAAGRPTVEDRHGRWDSWFGMGVGVLAALTVAALDGPRHFLLLTFTPLVGAGWLLGLLAAERSRPVPAVGTVLSADLTRRTPALYLGGASLLVMRLIYLVTGSAMVAAIGTASPDDPAAFTRRCSSLLSNGGGPWPGAPFAVPGLIGLGVGWLLTEAVLHRIASRPASPDLGRADQDLRVLASRTALVSAVLIASPNLGTVMVMTGGALRGICGSSSFELLGTGLLLGGLITMAASAGAWLVALMTGGRGVVVPPVASRP